MEQFKNFLDSLETRPLRVSKTKSGWKVQQTDSNNLKNELLTKLFETLVDSGLVVYRTNEGIYIEVPVKSVADALPPESDGSGALTIALDCKIKGLDTNAESEATAFDEKLAEKARKNAAKAEEKARKIERDKAARAKKEKGE